MARPTHGSHIRITPLDFKELKTVKDADGKDVEQWLPMANPPWSEHEWVQCRTLFTADDREWIYAHSVVSFADATQPNGVRVEANDIAAANATVARMLIAWRLDKQRLDSFGEPLVHPDGTYAMEENILPEKLDARLAAVRALNEADMIFVFQKIQDGTPAPMSKKEQESFLPSASVPTLEASKQAK